jgi:hypothetical protein
MCVMCVCVLKVALCVCMCMFCVLRCVCSDVFVSVLLCLHHCVYPEKKVYQMETRIYTVCVFIVILI